jgi:hypothetical protein
MISNLPTPKEYVEKLYYEMLDSVQFDNIQDRMQKSAIRCCITSIKNTKLFINSQTQGFLDSDLIQYLEQAEIEIQILNLKISQYEKMR